MYLLFGECVDVAMQAHHEAMLRIRVAAMILAIFNGSKMENLQSLQRSHKPSKMRRT